MPGNVQSVTPSFGDKVFEPVVSLRRDQSEEQAATLASESRFDLGAAIFTANIRNTRNLTEQRITNGSMAINTFVRRNPSIPFDGCEESSFIRKLGALGIH